MQNDPNDNQPNSSSLPLLPDLPKLPELQRPNNNDQALPPLTDPVMPEEYTAPTPTTSSTSLVYEETPPQQPSESSSFNTTYQPLNQERQTPEALPAFTPPSTPKNPPTPPSFTPPTRTTPTPPTPSETPRTPATPPMSSKPKSATPIALITLSVLTLTGITGATYYYLQNQALVKQLNTLQSIEQQRQFDQITPTPEVSPESTQSATPTATPSANPTNTTPSTSSQNNTFPHLISVLELARKQSSTAQLLMVTSENALTSETGTIKYWFRRAPNTKSYFFVQTSEQGDSELFTSANITPDNNIPDLIEYHTNNQLGIDLSAAHSLATTQVVQKATSEKPNKITAKYLRPLPSTPGTTTQINLWQLSYSFQSRADIVVQINANTSEVAFTNLPQN